MTETRVPIVLIGGPYDGETQLIPADAAHNGSTWCMAWCPIPSITAMMNMPSEGELERWPTHVRYRLLTVDFAGWPMPSRTDDGTLRYQYAGEG